MVNKIAVMAVVLIVAVPILLGYGLAFEEVEKTTWNESNTRSITSALYNDVKYSDVALNSYTINSKIVGQEGETLGLHYPEYVKVGATPVTSLPVGQDQYAASDTFIPANFGTGFITFAGGSADATINYTSGGSPASVTVTVGNMSFNGTSIIGTKYPNPFIYEYDNVTSVTFSESYTVQYELSSGSYADITYGWKLTESYLNWGAPDSYDTHLKIGTFTKTVLTVDFGEVLESLSPGTNTTFYLHPNGDKSPLSLTIAPNRGDSPGNSYLYLHGYDADGNNKYVNVPLDDTDFSKNVYQILINRTGIEVRYIGSWTNTIGTAPSLATWSFTHKYAGTSATYFDEIKYTVYNYVESPTFRLDTAIREGFASPAITDKSYDPLVLLPDSATGSYSISLSDIGYIGTSIGWGGETFEVKDGALIVDHKRIALSKLTLESKYLDGTRTNYINGKEISTGANTLQLNGTWGAIVSLTELTPETSTSNEWQPGEFAWNGVDSSFALMGLIASVGVFVGLGMYGKRSGAKVGMLMLICGGAALIFLALV